MEIEDLFPDFDVKKARDDLLIAAAKSANGYVYYEIKVKYNGDSRPERIDIYEKYAAPNRKLASFLKERGIKCVVHPRKPHKQ
jgi:hypothetical protein